MPKVAVAPRYKARTERRKSRDERIRKMFNNLYHNDRKRIDDVENEVSGFWGLSVITVRKIMKE